MTLTTNDTNSSIGLGLQTAGPVNVDFNSLAGGTVIRTILDIDANPDLVFNTGVTSIGFGIAHMGIFMTDGATVPSTALWDANKPFGNFMWRDGMSWWYRRDANADGGSITVNQYNPRRLHVDSVIKRRIGEGDSLFLTAHFFKDAGNVFNSVALGVTGRVLIRLP